MSHRAITARQSKQARALLKWNISDLASRTNVLPDRLERYERQSIRLTLPENKELKAVYEKEGIVFGENLDVTLKKQENKTAHTQEQEVVDGEAIEEKFRQWRRQTEQEYQKDDKYGH